MTIRILTLAWLTLLGTWLPHADLLAQARLRPIPDDSLAGLPERITLGETQLSWQRYTPQARAELIQVLAGRRYTVQLAAWNGSGDPQDPNARFDRKVVQIVDPKRARWWFSVSNDGKVARRMRWQLSRFPFDETADDWRAPAGMLASGEILRQSDRSLPERFDIDLGEFLLGGSRTDSALPTAVALTSMLHGDFPTGTMFLRLMAIGRNGSPVSLPSNTIRIELQPLSSGAPMASSLPQVEIAAFRALRPLAADSRCWVRATRALSLQPAVSIVENAPPPATDAAAVVIGETEAINLCSGDHNDLLPVIVNGFGSTEGMTERMRQWGRQRLEAVTEMVRDQTQSRFGGVTAACTSRCRQAITLVLEQVVSLAGGPPNSAFASADWARLQPYVRAMLRSALDRHSSLGPAFVDQAADGATELFMSQLAEPGELTPPAFEAAAEHQLQLPRIELALLAAEATPASWLQLRELSKSARLRPVLIPVPALQPGDRVIIPVTLSSSELPDYSTMLLPSRSALLEASNNATDLLREVTEHLRGLDKALAKAQRKASSGRLQLELSWRDAEGQHLPIGVARCRADRDDSCQLSLQ